MLLANVAEQLALSVRELVGVACIAARLGAKGQHAALAVGVVPALQRGDGEAAGALQARRTKQLVAQRRQLRRQLPALQQLASQGADDLAAKQRDLLGVVFGDKGRFGHGNSFLRRAKVRTAAQDPCAKAPIGRAEI